MWTYKYINISFHYLTPKGTFLHGQTPFDVYICVKFRARVLAVTICRNPRKGQDSRVITIVGTRFFARGL